MRTFDSAADVAHGAGHKLIKQDERHETEKQPIELTARTCAHGCGKMNNIDSIGNQPTRNNNDWCNLLTELGREHRQRNENDAAEYKWESEQVPEATACTLENDWERSSKVDGEPRENPDVRNRSRHFLVGWNCRVQRALFGDFIAEGNDRGNAGLIRGPLTVRPGERFAQDDDLLDESLTRLGVLHFDPLGESCRHRAGVELPLKADLVQVLVHLAAAEVEDNEDEQNPDQELKCFAAADDEAGDEVQRVADIEDAQGPHGQRDFRAGDFVDEVDERAEEAHGEPGPVLAIRDKRELRAYIYAEPEKETEGEARLVGRLGGGLRGFQRGFLGLVIAGMGGGSDWKMGGWTSVRGCALGRFNASAESSRAHRRRADAGYLRKEGIPLALLAPPPGGRRLPEEALWA